MAVVQFAFSVKYGGKRIPAHEPFQVDDKDYAELVASGAHTISAPEIKEENDSAPPQGDSSGDGEGGETPPSAPSEEVKTPEGDAEPVIYPVFTGNGWFTLSDGSKVHGSPEKAVEAEAALHA